MATVFVVVSILCLIDPLYGYLSNDAKIEAILQEVSHLKEVVSKQNNRMLELENTVEGQSKRIMELEDTVNFQKDRIIEVENILKEKSKHITELEIAFRDEKTFIDKIKGQFAEQEIVLNQNGSSESSDLVQTKHTDVPTISSKSGTRKVRLLEPGLPTQSPGGGIIAFYAIMSAAEHSPSPHHTLIFDKTKTNVGKGYSSNTGVFTAPRAGVYVFTWVIRLATAEHSTELVVDGIVYGATFLRAKGGDDGSVSGTVVAQLNQGSTVYIRTHSSQLGDGNIHTNTHGQPSFSGWILH